VPAAAGGVVTEAVRVAAKVTRRYCLGAVRRDVARLVGARVGVRVWDRVGVRGRLRGEGEGVG